MSSTAMSYLGLGIERRMKHFTEDFFFTRQKPPKFNPNSEQLQEHVDTYLANGGKITKLTVKDVHELYPDNTFNAKNAFPKNN